MFEIIQFETYISQKQFHTKIMGKYELFREEMCIVMFKNASPILHNCMLDHFWALVSLTQRLASILVTVDAFQISGSGEK